MKTTASDLASDDLRARLRRLSEMLQEVIRGQTEVLERLAAAVTRMELGAVPPRGPRGVAVFAGTTGVGKTQSAMILAETLWGPGHLAIFDASEHQNIASLPVLLGDRGGDRGQFGEAYLRVPHGVWLIDEIEKAHPQILQLLLQMADAGRVTQANGKTLDLSRIYLILTTNLGSAEILGREHLTFTSLERHVTRAVEQWLRPELLARLGAPYVFRPLSREVQCEIAAQRLTALLDWQRQEGRQVVAAEGVLDLLMRRGFSPRLGARPLLQASDELVGNAIAAELLRGGSGCGTLTVVGDSLELVS